MNEAPERIWLLWADGRIENRYQASATDHTEEGGCREFIRLDAHEAAVAAARKDGIDPDLISEKRIKYEALAARISVGKASQQEACDAIMQLCRDNERLAVIAGRLRAEASK